MLLQQVLGFVGGVFVAKLLGPADYGEVSVLRSLLTLIIVVTPLGLDLALFRILPRFDEKPHEQALHFRRFRLIVLMAGILLTLSGSLLVGPILAQRVYDYAGFNLHFGLTLLAIPFATDVFLLMAWYRVQGSLVPILLITYYFQPVVRTVLNVLAVYLGYGVLGVVIGTFAAYAAAFIMALPYHAWTQRRRSPTPVDARTPSWRESWEQFREAPPMALNLFAYSVMRAADLSIVGAIVDPHAVGEYAVVSNIAVIVPVAATSLMQTLGPAVARCHQVGDRAGIAREINHVIRWASVLASFIFGGVAGFGSHLDALFGKAYHPNPIIALLIPLGYLMSATLQPTSYALTMCGRSRTDLRILIVSAVFLIGSCVPLTYLFGTIGAASAVLATFTMTNVMRLVSVNRFLGVRLGRWQDAAPPVIALLLAVTFNRLLVPEHANLWRLLPGCVVYGLSYGLLMFGRPVLALLSARRGGTRRGVA
jgi:O-antigen/teichoic acid export membrane protein